MKAILVIDMPNNCEECNIIYFQGHGGRSTCDSGDWSKRPSWCPLKPLPIKKEQFNSWERDFRNEASYRAGYNDCLEDIIEETE